MKIKTRTFLKTKMMPCSDGVTRMITIYGELDEHDNVPGVMVFPCTVKGKSKPIEVADLSKDGRFVPFNKDSYGRTKEFYMGFAVCSPEDDFNQDTAIKICKRRFKKPIVTQNGRMLTPDMIDAIMTNEVKYISDHIELFLPKKENSLFE